MDHGDDLSDTRARSEQFQSSISRVIMLGCFWQYGLLVRFEGVHAMY